MTRKFTKHSYQYIQGWLKDKYKNDPEFKKNQLFVSGVCQLRKRLTLKNDILILDILAEDVKQYRI
jgi:hypothetical protein